MIKFLSSFFSRPGAGSEQGPVSAAVPRAARHLPVEASSPPGRPDADFTDGDEVGKTIAAVSHELRTPMNGILGIIELFERTDLDSRQRQLLQSLNASAHLMLATLNDLKVSEEQRRSNSTIGSGGRTRGVPEPSSRGPTQLHAQSANTRTRGNGSAGDPVTDLRQRSRAGSTAPMQGRISAVVNGAQRPAQTAPTNGRGVATDEQVAAIADDEKVEAVVGGEQGVAAVGGEQGVAVAGDEQDVAVAGGEQAEVVVGEVFDLCCCVEDVAASCARDLETGGNGFSVYVGSNVPNRIRADKQLVGSVLSALMKHAAQVGPVYVNVRRETVNGDYNRMRFSIRKMTPGREQLAPSPHRDVALNSRTEYWQAAQRYAAELDGELTVRQLADGEWSFEFSAEFEVAPDAWQSDDLSSLAEQRFLIIINSETERQIVANYLGAAAAEVVSAATTWEACQLMIDARNEGRALGAVMFEEDANYEKNADFLFEVTDIYGGDALPGMAMFAHCDASNGDRISELAQPIAVLSRPIRRRELFAAAKGCVSSSNVANIAPVMPAPTEAGHEARTAPCATDPKPAEPVQQAHGLGAYILVADDILINQEVMREHLAELGCTAKVVENGLQAVEAFRAETFDLILMDCQMPEMDGLTATHEIRQIEKEEELPRTPVVGVSAHVFEAERGLFLGGGKMDDFLCKPYSLEQLEDSIARALDIRRDGLAAPSAAVHAAG